MVLYSCKINLYVFFLLCVGHIYASRWLLVLNDSSELTYTWLFTGVFQSAYFFFIPCLGWKTSLPQFDSFTKSPFLRQPLQKGLKLHTSFHTHANNWNIHVFWPSLLVIELHTRCNHFKIFFHLPLVPDMFILSILYLFINPRIFSLP